MNVAKYLSVHGPKPKRMLLMYIPFIVSKSGDDCSDTVNVT